MKKFKQVKDLKTRMMIRPKAKANNVYQLYIYDEITSDREFDWENYKYIDSETSAEYFKQQLEGIPDNATIELYVNSVGGYVDEGTTIYNQLARHKAYKVGYVDGVAYSAASLVLMACDHIVMGLGTSMLVHNMWTFAMGNSEQLRKIADDMDKLMETNRQVYLNRMSITDEELQALMQEERYLTPDECLEYGLCDEISGKKQEDKDEEEDEDTQDSEQNPDEEDQDEENQDEENSDNEKDDEEQQKVMQMLSRLVMQMQKQNKRANQKVNPEPKTDNNKCCEFFDQFI